MATIVLQLAGSALGGAVGGPFGAILGRALGAAVGYKIDQKLFGPGDRNIEGPRLEHSQYLSSEEGAPISRIYGRARLSGQIIWATRFEEVQETENQSQGGKGAPKNTITRYSYFGNFAVGICEGPIATVRRIWVDGRLLDQTEVSFRVYKGSESQMPDSLIEAKQGTGNAPAYRGLSYIVFEHLPLESYGNRIPQISVEVIKPVGDLEKHVRAVSLLPGATEFGYDPLPVVEEISEVTVNRLNNHATIELSDWKTSIDELQAVCPNLESVALVCTWFGTDLRAGNCQCLPKVEAVKRDLQQGEAWQVSGELRANVPLVSMKDGRPVFGGTPGDGSILRAIADLKARGLRVMFYPFLMMDIPAGNGLPDPYGGAEQGAFPWRGRITCHPAPFQPGSPDGTQAATNEADNFFGLAAPGDFAAFGNTVTYSGPAEWSFRRLILHYAHLCALAGGVDAFLIGSEMRGLTTIRGTGNSFPTVTQLVDLAQDVKSITGSGTQVSYAADWSEYFGYQPALEPGSVYYHLDRLWADGSVDFIAIDNYMPLSDWRDDGDPGNDGRAANDPEMLAANISGGEGFDWYYASNSDRLSGNRIPITDGLGKPWVFRYKDIHNWWANTHYDRVSGVESSSASPWQPQMKPVWFSEIGCPGIDKGANQPNVFVDEKSVENAFPYFSSGKRDDGAMAAFLAAHQRYWDVAVSGHIASNNPPSTVYSGSMVDAANTHIWAWDARPFPNFPDDLNSWSDGENWHLGHWLNGRLGGARLADLIAEILQSHGFLNYDVSQVYGQIDGYVVAEASSARGSLEPLVNLFQLGVVEKANRLVFRSPGVDQVTQFNAPIMVDQDKVPLLTEKRAQETELPNEVQVRHVDPQTAFNATLSTSRRLEGASQRQVGFGLPAIMAPEVAVPLADQWLQANWTARDTIHFSLSREYTHLQVGDQIAVEEISTQKIWQISRIEDAEALSIEARAIERNGQSAAIIPVKPLLPNTLVGGQRPYVRFLDLPILSGDNPLKASRVVAAASPWPGEVAVLASPLNDGFTLRQTLDLGGFVGKIVSPVTGQISGRWDHATTLTVAMLTGTLSSLPEELVLNGGNSAFIRAANGEWEVLQFLNANLVLSNTWALTGLLRGQVGTEVEMLAGTVADADFILLNQAVPMLDYAFGEIGVPLQWRAGPANQTINTENFVAQQFTPGLRGVRPLSPVHLQVDKLQNQDLSLSWIRRDRINADAWTYNDIPMSEQTERYQLNSVALGQTLRSWEVTTATSLYAQSEWQADQLVAGGPMSIEVRQISDSFGPGLPVSQILPV